MPITYSFPKNNTIAVFYDSWIHSITTNSRTGPVIVIASILTMFFIIINIVSYIRSCLEVHRSNAKGKLLHKQKYIALKSDGSTSEETSDDVELEDGFDMINEFTNVEKKKKNEEEEEETKEKKLV